MIEPSWKLILGNKAILPLLWEMFPEHKNLLPAYFMDPIKQMRQNKEYDIKIKNEEDDQFKPNYKDIKISNIQGIKKYKMNKIRKYLELSMIFLLSVFSS